jgi:hypothetical protein
MTENTEVMGEAARILIEHGPMWPTQLEQQRKLLLGAESRVCPAMINM